jgi:hypothetical protein
MEHPRRPPNKSSAVLLAGGLLAFFTILYPSLGFGFPVGPDAPVYLWWVRVAGVDGLSAVGIRPGAPAALMALGEAMGLGAFGETRGLGAPLAQAALGCALGCATGLAAATFVPGLSRGRWLLVGALGGTFAAHVAGGYLANLSLVVLLLAAAAVLTRSAAPASVGRVSIAAGLLLGAGGLAHPLFLGLGVAILGLAAVLHRRSAHRTEEAPPKSEAGRIAAATGIGIAVAGAGFLALTVGPGPLDVDTSKDAFLRRVGLGGSLRGDYVTRLGRLWARFVLPVSVPLAAWDLARRREGFAGWILVCWGIVTVAGVAAALVTGLAPAARFLSFAYVLPIGGALAVGPLMSRITRRAGRRPAVVAGVVLTASILAGATWTWWHQHPFIHDVEASALESVAMQVDAFPDGTPLVFLIDRDDPEVTFLATLAGNVIRAAMPPERVRDVHLFVGTPADYVARRPTVRGDPRYDAMSRHYLGDVVAAGGRPYAFVLEAFDPIGLRPARGFGIPLGPDIVLIGPTPARPGEVSDTVVGPPPKPLRPFSPWAVPPAGAMVLVALSLVGLGWSRAALGRGTISLALAPAFGLAAVILSAVAIDRLGVRLDAPLPGLIALALPAACGYLASVRLQRDAEVDPVTEVDEEPDEHHEDRRGDHVVQGEHHRLEDLAAPQRLGDGLRHGEGHRDRDRGEPRDQR